MPRLSPFNSPLLLGFDRLEQVLERLSRAPSDGYPPYNVLRIGEDRLRISLAVAGFKDEELSVTIEQNQLLVHGLQSEDPEAVYLYRGIAARRFQRSFLLADGIEVESAELENGLLHVNLIVPVPIAAVRTIKIRNKRAQAASLKHTATQLTGQEAD